MGYICCVYVNCFSGESIIAVSEFNELDGYGWWGDEWALVVVGGSYYA